MMQRMQGQGKLGAYQTNGGDAWDPEPGENVLYLGAAEGATASWMCKQLDGTIVAVEKSPVAGLSLLRSARELDHLIPYIGDARNTGSYAPFVPSLGFVYQDIAQRDQVDIFVKNVERFSPRRAFLAVKARSIAVERDPKSVFEDAREAVEEAGRVVDVVSLDPFHKDHAMIVVDTVGE